MIFMQIREGTKVKSRKNFRWVHKGQACRADVGAPGTVIQDSANCEVYVEWDCASAKGIIIVDVADVDVIL